MSPDSPPVPPVLDVRGLNVHVGDTALVSGVDLRIDRGERVGLIGESGSGKSLTALSVMGLLADGLRSSGSVQLWPGASDKPVQVVGMPDDQLRQLRGAAMTMVFQEPMTALNPTMRVGDQVAEVMLIHQTQPNRKAARAEVVRLLDEVGLRDPEQAARAYPHQLSGGQRQRVVIAIALANDPALLICDEPTTALDVTVQARVLDLLVKEVETREAGMLFITHDLAVVATVCEKVAVMLGGKIVESGPVAEVFTNPRHDYTRQLLAASDLSAVDPEGRFASGRAGPGTRADLSRGRRREASDDPATAPVIRVQDVTRVYRRSIAPWAGERATVQALAGVSLEVNRGERIGIVGESGCGKSTLLRIIAGLDRATSGIVEVNGQDITRARERHLRPLRGELQMVFQDPMGSLDPRMKVADIVAEPLVAQGIPHDRRRIAELFEWVGVDPGTMHRYPHQFSGGQRQRISIARALAPEPSILLADEPVSALDVSVRAQVLNLLTDLVNELGLTLVMVSHDLSVIRHVCRRVLVMESGLIVEQGESSALYENPQHPYTQRLIAAVPTLERALSGATTADLTKTS